MTAGIVAENSATCRVGGVWLRIHSTSSMNPIRNISSASSSTTVLSAAEFQRSATHVIHQPAGCADDDVHAAFELTQLHRVVLAAVYRQYLEATQVARIRLKCFGHLNGQFARRGQHQNLWFRPPQIEARQQRQREGGGFAGARLRLTYDVAPCQQMRNGGNLNRRRRFVTDIPHRREHLGTQSEIRKRLQRFFGHRNSDVLEVRRIAGDSLSAGVFPDSVTQSGR